MVESEAGLLEMGAQVRGQNQIKGLKEKIICKKHE